MQVKTFSFTYYVNVQEDAQGRRTGWDVGYIAGDALQIAYRGFVAADPPGTGRQRLETMAEALFSRFNNPDLRPAGYRGPSMSVGSVVEIQGVHFAVDPLGFKEVEIWQSSIAPRDSRWFLCCDAGDSTDRSVLTT
jgi:hypothetical protein